MTFFISEIWENVIKGDAEAWGRLVSRYTPLIYSVARRAGLTSYDAEDCAQTTWIALYRSKSKILDPEKLPSWLIRTAHRNAVRLMQSHYRERIDIPDFQKEQINLIPEEELLKYEKLDALILALEQMDERCRKILSALFLSPDEQSYQAIAKSVGLAPNSLGPIRARCLERLKKIMKNLGY